MKTIQVKNLSNEVLREVELPEAVFEYPYKEHLVHTAVEAYRAAQRAGTHKAKVRSEVRGSGKKLWRQKGTGRARMGSVRSPIWRKGGTVHGPVPRSYDKKLSVREKKNALKSVLSQKLVDEGLVVIDSLQLESHKTKALDQALGGLGLSNKTLLVDSGLNENLERAAQNNPRLKTVDALGVNVYDVIARDHVVLTEGALAKLVEVLTK